MVIRDLRIYAQAVDAEVLQYRDNSGLEIDAVVRARDGRWAAVEIKLGHREVDDAARNLLKLRDGRVDTAKAGGPMMLAVILSTGLSYMREDGVAVISVGSLGP